MAADDVTNDSSLNPTEVVEVSDISVTSPAADLPAISPESPSWMGSAFRQPLSKLQALVGVTAGLISVASVVAPIAANVRIPASGEFVGVIETARSHKPVLEAAVEISSRRGETIVTTLVSNADGRVQLSLKEGQYRVRVRHREFMPEVRNVLVIGGQTSEVHLMLAPRPAAPPVVTVTPAKPRDKRTAVRRWFSAGAQPGRDALARPQTP